MSPTGNTYDNCRYGPIEKCLKSPPECPIADGAMHLAKFLHLLTENDNNEREQEALREVKE